MDLRVDTKVRFNEPYRPPQVRWGAIGVIIDMEERRTTFGPAFYVRARFGDFMTPRVGGGPDGEMGRAQSHERKPMSAFKNSDDFNERLRTAANARKATLEKFRAWMKVQWQHHLPGNRVRSPHNSHK